MGYEKVRFQTSVLKCGDGGETVNFLKRDNSLVCFCVCVCVLNISMESLKINLKYFLFELKWMTLYSNIEVQLRYNRSEFEAKGKKKKKVFFLMSCAMVISYDFR